MAAPRRPVKCRYPILLLHGLFGFVEKRLGSFRLTYYREVIPYLASVGNRVAAVRVSPRGTVARRAGEIRDFIETHPFYSESPLNLIGHSMGGLDGRYLISRLGFGDRIKSLTTLSTPHRGSLLADLVSRIPGARRIVPALADLTEKRAETFDEEMPRNPGTVYLSVPAATGFLSCCPFLWPTYGILRLTRGPNDGQVTVDSASWGEILEVVESDHLELIGLRCGLNVFRGSNHLDLFGRITERLAERGF